MVAYEERTYRQWTQSDDLVSFELAIGETDLLISAERDLSREAERSIRRHRQVLEEYIASDPGFLEALEPHPTKTDAPAIVQDMAEAANAVGVGPMAAVAGVVAEYVGRDLLEHSDQVIVENGGDIFLATQVARKIGIYAGGSPLTGHVKIEIDPVKTPLGVCTSSGTVGHSVSFGHADAAVVLAHRAALSDAAATALGNRIQSAEDIVNGLQWVQTITGILGALIVVGQNMGAWGKVQLAQ